MSRRWLKPSGIKSFHLALGVAALLSACGPTPAAPAAVSTAALSAAPPATQTPLPPSPSPLPPATATSSPVPSLTPSPSASPSPSPTSAPLVCSPLAEVSLAELPGIIAGNTFQTPQPSRDDGHPGIDFAFYSHGARKTMAGLPVLSAFAGRVAAVLPDRPPYGNLVIIETPLDSLPQRRPGILFTATPAPTVVPDARLTCPAVLELPRWDTSHRSLYIAYGHLQEPSPLKAGDPVQCGQPLGAVGTTGASVNYHLHFEARTGPSGATFTSFGHYDARSTALERNNYCLWRVSGWFQLFDPLKLLLQP